MRIELCNTCATTRRLRHLLDEAHKQVGAAACLDSDATSEDLVDESSLMADRLRHAVKKLDDEWWTALTDGACPNEDCASHKANEPHWSKAEELLRAAVECRACAGDPGVHTCRNDEARAFLRERR
jgi:hypothetical protein